MGAIAPVVKCDHTMRSHARASARAEFARDAIVVGEGGGQAFVLCHQGVATEIRASIGRVIGIISLYFFWTTLMDPLFSSTAYCTSWIPEHPAWRNAALSSWCVNRASVIAASYSLPL
jgi:hypothetical protein